MGSSCSRNTDLPVNYIGSVLKNNEVCHGIAIIDNGNKSFSEKATKLQTLQIGSDTESIELTCEKKQASTFFGEYLKLKGPMRVIRDASSGEILS